MAIFDQHGQRCDLLALLRRADAPLDVAVTMGAQHRLPVRVLAVPVLPAVADQRRRRFRQPWRDNGRTPSAWVLALAAWTVAITTVPTGLVTLPEALVVLRARWPIELRVKLRKSHGQVAMVVLHWVLVVTCWHDPKRRLRKAAQPLHHHALTLVHALVPSHRRAQAAVHLLQACFTIDGRLNARHKQPHTYQLLLAC